MTQSDGEKELVLGNKQLISLFFVAVALCGVFFAVGYMIGRNTSKSATASLDGSSAPPPAASTAPQTQESEPPRETTAETQPPAPVDTAPVTATQTRPARDAPAEPAPPSYVPAAAVSVPESGATYLQVTALRKGDADNLVKTLREQKFPALVADSSKPDLFRVLVGPYHQIADVADAKARLKALGFANAFVQK